MTFHLFSSAFAPRSTIPARHTCDGDDVSPPLEWSEPPDGVQGFALIMSDPDAPKGTWYHWGVYDIPATAYELPEAFPKEPEVEGIRQALNNFRKYGWGGPCPPHHHHVKHHYRFRLLALDTDHLALPIDATCRELERVAEAHILDETTLTGIFHR